MGIPLWLEKIIKNKKMPAVPAGEKKYFLLDQDGPLTNYEQGFAQAYKKKYPGAFFLPVEERRRWSLKDDYPEECWEKIHLVLHAPSFFLDLEPIPGSIEAIKTIMALGHQVFICTAPGRGFFNLEQKYFWVVKYFGEEFAYNRLVPALDKTVILGHKLVDDHPEVSKGARKPDWEHIIWDMPYNRHLPGKRLLNWQGNWREVLGV